MSYIPLGQLADFVPVGPHYYTVDRPNAVQVIQRGPHGMRFAADPVRTREGKERGSGFRFWVEQLNVKPDEMWNPREKVVGLMGMGQSAKREASPEQKISLTNQALNLLDRANNSPIETLPAVEGETRAARAALSSFFPWSEQTESEKYGLAAGAAVAAKLSSEWTGFSVPGPDWPSSSRVLANLELAQLTVNKRLSYRPAPPKFDASPLGPDDIWGRTGRNLPGSFGDPSNCPPYDLVCFAKKHWWKFALGAGAVFFLYGAGKGVGAGAFKKFIG